MQPCCLHCWALVASVRSRQCIAVITVSTVSKLKVEPYRTQYWSIGSQDGPEELQFSPSETLRVTDAIVTPSCAGVTCLAKACRKSGIKLLPSQHRADGY